VLDQKSDVSVIQLREKVIEDSKINIEKSIVFIDKVVMDKLEKSSKLDRDKNKQEEIAKKEIKEVKKEDLSKMAEETKAARDLTLKEEEVKRKEKEERQKKEIRSSVINNETLVLEDA